MENKPNVTFENRESAHEFVTIIKREPGEDVQESNQGGNQESNQETHQVLHQETHQEIVRKLQLTKEQRDIVNFCSVPRSTKEILERRGLYNQSRTRKRHIQPLLDMGVLEMTIPDNPKDRNQKK